MPNLDLSPGAESLDQPEKLTLPILPASPPAIRTPPPTSLTVAVLDNQGLERLLGSLLESAGMTASQLATACGVTQQTIYSYMHGLRPNPRLRTIIRLIELTGARIMVEYPKRSVR